jgi:drug/metabolite transporter (DMT)-like permease
MVTERRAVVLSVIGALVFGVGIVAAGRSAQVLPVAWVAVTARAVGIVLVALPLVVTRRLSVTREALPLVIVAGVGEIVGSMASAWGSRESIAVTAVLGSQFAAIAAVGAYLLFGERLARIQLVGVVLIVTGVSALAATSL